MFLHFSDGVREMDIKEEHIIGVMDGNQDGLSVLLLSSGEKIEVMGSLKTIIDGWKEREAKRRNMMAAVQHGTPLT